MGHKFAELAFTDRVKALQTANGSRRNYARMEDVPDYNDVIGPSEAAFITARDSFYMATVSETGWPYVQHRGGPAGFVKVLDEKTLGFADFTGNRQYVSAGNLSGDDRVSLFFMDYPNKARLKLLGHARLVGLEESDILAKLELPGYRARVERGILITMAGFDWNCPQHITQRYTLAEVEKATEGLRQRVAELEARSEEGSAAT